MRGGLGLRGLALSAGVAVACGGPGPASEVAPVGDAAAPIPVSDDAGARPSNGGDAGADREAPAPATCFDSIPNGDETGLDCGGKCERCREGSSCRSSDDCALGDCYRGVCALPPMIRRVTPSSAISTGGTALSIRGYFVPGVSLTIGGKPTNVTFVSDSEIQVALPPALGAFGAAGIRAIFPDGQSGSNSHAFYYSATVFAFAPATSVATPGSPLSATIGDVDGDGRPDLVTTDPTAGTLGVALGNGDGTFRARIDTLAGAGAAALVLADLNGDGAPDAVVTNGPASTVSVLLGRGDGAMLPATPYATGAGAVALLLADVNADGNADLTVACADGSVGVLLGRGNGTFAPRIDVAAGVAPSALAIGDFDNDLVPDLVVAEPSANSVGVFTGDGSGGFRATASYAVAAGPRWVFAYDLNGDAILDILTVSDDGTVTALFANRDGTFQREFLTSATLSGVTAVTFADTNGDNKPDLVVGTASETAIFLNHGGASFRSAIPSFAAGARSIAVADVNGDAKPDIFMTAASAVTGVMNSSH